MMDASNEIKMIER